MIAVVLSLSRGAVAQPPTSNGFANIEEIIANAKQGSLKDQTKLGDYYMSKSNFTNAVHWYRSAAEKGEPEAMLSLASCYMAGRGVEKNAQESTRWMRLAATRLGDKLDDTSEVTTNAATAATTNATPAESAGQRTSCQRVHVLQRVDPAIVQPAPVLRPASLD